MNITNASNVVVYLKKIMKGASLVAVARYCLLSNAVLRILWMILGILLYGLTTAPPTTVTNVDPGHAVIMKYKEMVTRDDKLLNVLLDSSWKRECKYRVVPWHQLADGTIRQTIIQECDEVE